METWNRVGLLVNKDLLYFVPELKPGEWYVLTVKLPLQVPSGNLSLDLLKDTLSLQLQPLEEILEYRHKKLESNKNPQGISEANPSVPTVGLSKLTVNPWEICHSERRFIRMSLMRILEKYCYIPHRYNSFEKIFKIRGEETEKLRFETSFQAHVRPTYKVSVKTFSTPLKTLSFNEVSKIVHKRKKMNFSNRRSFVGSTQTRIAEELITAELIAKIYSEIGVLNSNTILNNVLPVDFFYGDGHHKIRRVNRSPIEVPFP